MALHHAISRAITGPVPTKIIPAELLKPSFYGMLMVYYFAMSLYGVTASIFGSVSVLEATNSHFTTIWSAIIMVVGLIAGVGVWLSRRFKREWVEVISTSTLVGMMASYAVSIFFHGLSTGHAGSIPSVWLPIIISILPVWRLAMIGIEGSLFKNRNNRKKGN